MENEKEKSKRGRKPAAKDLNAAGGVVDENGPQRELAFFTIGPEADRLPPIQDPRGTFTNAIGSLADVAYMSGYFGDDTPAQLAIKILTGIFLETEPIAALFDLEIKPGNRIGWKAGGQPTAEAAELEQPLRLAKPNVVDFRPAEIPANVKDELAGGDWAENANKGPLLETGRETAQDVAGGENGDPSHESGEMATESASITGDDLGFPTEPAETDPFASPAEPDRPETVDEEFDRVTRPDPPPATTPPAALEASTVKPEILAGIEVGATIATWRNSIERWIRELEFATDVIVAKLAKFDAGTTLEKKAMFEQAEALYRTRLSTKRGDVLLALARDGKKSLEQMAGTFAYFEVPGNPETWTFADAIKAFRIIEKETPQLLEDPPKEKPAAK